MKLKKIASLMLAGIMAVSMLAACGEGKGNGSSSSSSSTPAVSNFTSSVLAKTSEATRDKLTVNSDTKLDEAVAWAAKNNTYGTNRTTLHNELGNTILDDVKNIMGDEGDKLTYGDNKLMGASAWNFTNESKDKTYVTFCVDVS